MFLSNTISRHSRGKWESREERWKSGEDIPGAIKERESQISLGIQAADS